MTQHTLESTHRKAPFIESKRSRFSHPMHFIPSVLFFLSPHYIISCLSSSLFFSFLHPSLYILSLLHSSLLPTIFHLILFSSFSLYTYPPPPLLYVSPTLILTLTLSLLLPLSLSFPLSHSLSHSHSHSASFTTSCVHSLYYVSFLNYRFVCANLKPDI